MSRPAWCRNLRRRIVGRPAGNGPSVEATRSGDLRQKLVALTAEVVQTEDELAALESDGQLTLGATPASAVQIPRMPAEKIALFLDLFGTRRSVYPKRWESSKTGKSGYSPACGNDSFANRQTGICQKPKIKCAECCHQRFPSLAEHAIEAHLRGEQTLGVYAIGTDATGQFLSADFDGEGWRDDVLAYRESLMPSAHGVPCRRVRPR